MSALEIEAIIGGAIATFATAIIQKKPKNSNNKNEYVVSARVLCNEGDEYRKLKQNEQALEKYRAAAKQKPDEALYHDKAAELLNELGRHHEALDENIKAVARETNSEKLAWYYLHKANTLLNLNRVGNAVADMRKAASLVPCNAAYHHDLGECLFRRMRQYEEAEKEYRKATEYALKNAKYHYDLGVFLAQQGRCKEALEPLKKATQLEPNIVDYKDALRRVERALKESR